MAKKMIRFGASFLALGAFALGASTVRAAAPDMYDGQLHFSLTPYLWLPTIYSTIDLNLPPPLGGTTEAKINPNQYLNLAKFGAIGAGEVRKGDWSVGTDVLYLRLANEKGTVGSLQRADGSTVVPDSSYANGSLNILIWELFGSRTVWRSSYGTLDVLTGLRYADLRTSVDIGIVVGPSAFFGTPSYTNHLIDGIVGVKGALNVYDNGKWYAPYEFDIGGATGNTTYNGLVAGGYRFGWGNVLVGWRELKFKFSGRALQDVRFSGPLIGATFQW